MLFGSHDCAANTFDFSVSFWKSGKWEVLRRLACVFRCVRNRIVELSRTQHLTIAEQLEQGARILDIRVSYSNGTFYTSHTFCCGLLADTLAQIQSFIDRKPDMDRLVLLFSPDFQNQGGMVGHETELLELIRGFNDVEEVNVLYKPLQIDLSAYPVEDMSRVANSYYNVDTVAEFQRRFAETEFGDESLLHCVLTPQPQIKKLMKASIVKYAAELNPVALRLLKPNEYPEGAIFDFFNRDLFKDI